MLSINSEDDLILDLNSIPIDQIEKNPNLIHLSVGGGGHIEYLSSTFPKMVNIIINYKWGFRIACEYLKAFNEDF